MTTSMRVKGMVAQMHGWGDWELRELIDEVENLRDMNMRYQMPTVKPKYRVGGSAS
ncbi:hypothetical protein Pse7367_1295 [Thalassoporum mexicanum PCC 7367]|uniref:hypothetical protein n=1 Tax=Thalassoporum mexicanum TaxID=3457544 RepID=UPI00029FC62C|nr:hypothetical protein [Pseudanabaena sp. PCC 7367]AFY69589.1 hypothetical protein Pse7367_1295 [Pseudanabaena sp. PCC 7367]